jgi:hypothetical protein
LILPAENDDADARVRRRPHVAHQDVDGAEEKGKRNSKQGKYQVAASWSFESHRLTSGPSESGEASLDSN